jgi:hypothetical protein
VSDDVRVVVDSERLVTVRHAMRGLNRMVAELLADRGARFVLMQGGKMVAAVVPLRAVSVDAEERAELWEAVAHKVAAGLREALIDVGAKGVDDPATMRGAVLGREAMREYEELVARG